MKQSTVGGLCYFAISGFGIWRGGAARRSGPSCKKTVKTALIGCFAGHSVL